MIMPKGVYKRTTKIREKMSKIMKGRIPWNKGLSKENDSRIKTYWLGKKRPEVKNWLKCPKETSRKNLKNYMENHGPWNKGKTLSYKHRLALSEAHKGQIPWNYKGGVKSVYDKIRWSLEYKEWRKAVFERDNYTCLDCGKKSHQKSGKLNADHIKQFAFYPKLRFNLDNGRTLCVPCHKDTETYGRGEM